jgi:hypothetical protein
MLSKTNFYKNLIKFRKLIFLKNKLKNNIFKFILICDFNNFNGLALKLLKSQFLNLMFSSTLTFKPYKNLFKFYFHKKINKQSQIYFKFKNIKTLILLIDYFKTLSIIPFLIYPLFILNKKKNIIFPLNQLYFLKNININNLLINIIINPLKKIVLNIFIKFFIKN